MTEARRPRKVQSAATGDRSQAAHTRTRNRSMAGLLREMYGTLADVEAHGRIHLPGWAISELALKRGYRLDFVVVADSLGLCPAGLRPFNRGTLLSDGSVRLPTVVLDYAAIGPLVLEPLGDGSYRLCRAGPAGELAEASAASWPRFQARISAAGRLLMPAPVIAGLGAEAGDLLVFRARDDGSMEIQALGLLVARTAAALRDLAAGVSHGYEEHERQQADAREQAVGDPLAGTWRPT
jgi:bifunctional DNA-binding transcriptional regulator/antitoxin component of YhaV-PrlF toxin-antitoxin module